MNFFIQIKNLYKSYFQNNIIEIPVIKDLNLEIKSGEFLSLMGPSGSGKSTLLNLIGLLDHPNKGKIFLNQEDITKLESNEKALLRNQQFGFVFQGFNLLKRISVLDNVALPLIYQGVERFLAQNRAKDVLKSTGLDGFENRLPNQLSGGQQQRVAIARALVVNPKLILADEPTGNLDSKTASGIMKTFYELNIKNKITIILVTHEEEIAQFGSRIIKMRDGQILTDVVNSQTL
ncbi:MAG: macrolide ABC transporter ATP-binding protein [Betaproteobacteria bacterium TMED41]|nr:MAG: macrolide ABC transporter ATP-binding protein [Betaproteobacteria bacterium TMED41]|tara:strand:- start:263 stop:964 length:702 start_codon:yes stop_codon:yes gene_type:complete